jgi:hypothetical protein
LFSEAAGSRSPPPSPSTMCLFYITMC